MMPDEYIIYREEHKNNGASDWKKLYQKLNKSQRARLTHIVSGNIEESILKDVPPSNFRKLLAHYVEAKKISALKRKGYKTV
jgi:hypothetical protein